MHRHQHADRIVTRTSVRDDETYLYRDMPSMSMSISEDLRLRDSTACDILTLSAHSTGGTRSAQVPLVALCDTGLLRSPHDRDHRHRHVSPSAPTVVSLAIQSMTHVDEDSKHGGQNGRSEGLDDHQLLWTAELGGWIRCRRLPPFPRPHIEGVSHTGTGIDTDNGDTTLPFPVVAEVGIPDGVDPTAVCVVTANTSRNVSRVWFGRCDGALFTFDAFVPSSVDGEGGATVPWGTLPPALTRLPTVHEDTITGLSTSESVLYSCCSKGTVARWDTERLTCRAVVQVRRHGSVNVCLPVDSVGLVTHNDAHALTVLDDRSDASLVAPPLLELHGHTSDILSIAVVDGDHDDDGMQTLWSGSADETIRCWRLPMLLRRSHQSPYQRTHSKHDEGYCVKVLPLHCGPVHLLRRMSPELMLSAAVDGSVGVWDVKTQVALFHTRSVATQPTHHSHNSSGIHSRTTGSSPSPPPQPTGGALFSPSRQPQPHHGGSTPGKYFAFSALPIGYVMVPRVLMGVTDGSLRDLLAVTTIPATAERVTSTVTKDAENSAMETHHGGADDGQLALEAAMDEAAVRVVEMTEAEQRLHVQLAWAAEWHYVTSSYCRVCMKWCQQANDAVAEALRSAAVWESRCTDVQQSSSRRASDEREAQESLIATLRAESEALEARLTVACNERDTFKVEAATSRDQLEEWRVMMADAMARELHREDVVAKLEAERTELQTELQRFRDQMADLRSTHRQELARMAAVQREAELETTELTATLRRDAADLRRERDTARHACTRLESELASLRPAVDQQRDALGMAHQKLTELGVIQAASQNRIRDLEKEMSDAQLRTTLMVDEHQSKLRQMEETSARTIRELTSKLTQMQERDQALHKHFDDLSKSCESCQRQLAEEQQHNVDLRDTLEKERRRWEDARMHAETTVQALRAAEAVGQRHLAWVHADYGVKLSSHVFALASATMVGTEVSEESSRTSLLRAFDRELWTIQNTAIATELEMTLLSIERELSNAARWQPSSSASPSSSISLSSLSPRSRRGGGSLLDAVPSSLLGRVQRSVSVVVAEQRTMAEQLEAHETAAARSKQDAVELLKMTELLVRDAQCEKEELGVRHSEALLQLRSELQRDNDAQLRQSMSQVTENFTTQVTELRHAVTEARQRCTDVMSQLSAAQESLASARSAHAASLTAAETRARDVEERLKSDVVLFAGERDYWRQQHDVANEARNSALSRMDSLEREIESLKAFQRDSMQLHLEAEHHMQSERRQLQAERDELRRTVDALQIDIDQREAKQQQLVADLNSATTQLHETRIAFSAEREAWLQSQAQYKHRQDALLHENAQLTARVEDQARVIEEHVSRAQRQDVAAKHMMQQVQHNMQDLTTDASNAKMESQRLHQLLHDAVKERDQFATEARLAKQHADKWMGECHSLQRRFSDFYEKQQRERELDISARTEAEQHARLLKQEHQRLSQEFQSLQSTTSQLRAVHRDKDELLSILATELQQRTQQPQVPPHGSVQMHPNHSSATNQGSSSSAFLPRVFC